MSKKSNIVVRRNEKRPHDEKNIEKKKKVKGASRYK